MNALSARIPATVFLAAVGFASPSPMPAKADSSPEILYVASCNRGSSEHDIEIAWYADWSHSQHGETPRAISVASVRSVEGLVDYEARFDDGNHASVIVEADVPVSGRAGTGKNDFRLFDCYRDNERTLFESGNFGCSSLFYCTAK